jgi:hypothetical protein
LYFFLLGGVISLLWCLFGLVIIILRETPRTSMFSDVDLLTKVSGSEGLNHRAPIGAGESLQTSLVRLRDANSFQIRKRLAGTKIYVPVGETQVDIAVDIDFEEGERSRLSGRPHSDVEEDSLQGQPND